MNSDELKACYRPLQLAAAEFEPAAMRAELHRLFSADVQLHLCHPFGDLQGRDALWDYAFDPLLNALPDLERRDMIVLAGLTPEGQGWVGAMGNYMGTFVAPFLGIPPTGHLAHMRYHEFFRFAEGRIVEMQAIWDLPELMMLAKAWPMAPQLGAYLCTPAPMSGDGLAVSGDGATAMRRVLDMLEDLCKYPGNPDPQIMNLHRHWHPKFNWYGPAGIGSTRGVAGFRHWHQIPFLRAMPDRKLDAMADLMSHWVAEGQYVCETGWPNMRLTVSGHGWMGIAPAGREVLMRSLDFWRVENGLIRENWVLVDLLDIYRQLGVDVFDRLQEFNKARSGAGISIPDPLQ